MNIEFTTRIIPDDASRGRVRLLGMLGVGAALGAGALYAADPVSGRRRRSIARDRAGGLARRAWRDVARSARGVRAMGYGMSRKAQHARERPKVFDDATLARKVESELFRDPDVPKGQINVNVQRGLVQLRGEVPTQDMLTALVERARRIQGVAEVESLLHLPGTPAAMHQ